MTWTRISTAEQAADFLESVNDFHDGCLREAHVWTEHYVGPELSMGIGLGWDTRARLLIQRQFRGLSAVELLFEEVRHLNVAPSPPDYEDIIFDAALLVRDGVIYWAAAADWSPDHPERDQTTWISGGKLSWRDASEWMGDTLRYGPTGPAAPAA
jgi:hypothetical protein